MSKKIRITSLAKKDLAVILEYLHYKWNAKIANDFIETLEHTINIIAENPEYFPYFIREKNLRKCVVTKHNTLYYRDEATQITIIRIFDVRQRPHKLKLS